MLSDLRFVAITKTRLIQIIIKNILKTMKRMSFTLHK